MSWTAEQVLALAPDSSSASAGRSLASASRWHGLERDERCLWGDCPGSGSKPYAVQIDLTEPAFKCTCPSRKFPCKHGLALLLIFAAQPNAFGIAAPPPRVVEWIQKRDERQSEKAEKAEAKTPANPVKAAAQQLKRADDREKKVAAGIDELDLWLQDQVRQGLASGKNMSTQTWVNRSARLVDAQAPGLARRIRQLGEATKGLDGMAWVQRLLSELGSLQLLIDAYRNLESLTPDLRETVRGHIGWPVKREEVLSGPTVRDTWACIGTRLSYEEPGIVRRTWLMGTNTGSTALWLSFAPAHQGLEPGIPPGGCIGGELCFYPGSLALRALVKSIEPVPVSITAAEIVAQNDSNNWQTRYAEALAQDPWLQTYPVTINGVTPAWHNNRILLNSADGNAIPLDIWDAYARRLLAFSGGHPVQISGEWDGYVFKPLAAWAGTRCILLCSQEEV